jgi:uncharacterized protein YndB with AHSA1/START domain
MEQQTATTEPFVIEQTYNAPISKVWQAITDRDKMKEWYFDLKEFKPEVGFEFEFTGGSEEIKYIHRCKVTQVVPGKKIAYTWRYDDYPGNSEVTFELFEEGDKTKLKLTHSGLHTFPTGSADFARSSFAKGWAYITGTSLKGYLEKD